MCSGARRRRRRLPDRGSVAVQNLVDPRVAVRNQRGDGARGLRRALRHPSQSQDHHASHGRHNPLLRSTGRARVGIKLGTVVRCGLHRRASAVEAPADRLLPAVLRRHGPVRSRRGHCVRAELFRRGPRGKASDAPFEFRPGLYIRETIDIVERLPIADESRARIYAGNAARLLKLPRRRTAAISEQAY